MPLFGPLRQGATEQRSADAPTRGRGPSTASVVREPEGSGSQFPKKQVLTHARRSIVFIAGAQPDLFSARIPIRVKSALTNRRASDPTYWPVYPGQPGRISNPLEIM